MAEKDGVMSPRAGRAGYRPWPLLRSLAGYRAEYLARDLAAGLTLAAIAIPEQMATALLGGFAP
jgi:sulfate permease, SulP family